MTAIIDYGVGNLFSLQSSFAAIGEQACVTRDPDVLTRADRLVLPGVGAFKDARQALKESGLEETVLQLVRSGKPLLGICLGLQLLFESSEENPGVEGLGLLKGKIVRLPEGDDRKIPHMGWNSLEFPKKSILFNKVVKGSYVYFVHSYYLKAEDEKIVAATCEYGTTVHAAVEWGNIYATQFHPEKGSSVGLRILKNFLEA